MTEYISFIPNADSPTIHVEHRELNTGMLLRANEYPAEMARRMWTDARKAGVPVVSTKGSVDQDEQTLSATLAGDMVAVLSQIDELEDHFRSFGTKTYEQKGESWTVGLTIQFEVFRCVTPEGPSLYFSKGEALAHAGEYNALHGSGAIVA